MLEKLLSPDDVAAILQVSRRTAYTIMHQMPHLERPFRVSESGLRAWLAGRTVSPQDPADRGKKPARRFPQKQLLTPEYHIDRRRE